MEQFKNILVATDTRLTSHPILDEMAELAAGSGARLKIVDVVPDFPLIARLALRDHPHLLELKLQEKQAQLDAIAQPLRERGLKVEAKALRGKTSVEIIREVLRSSHDLVARVAKGKDSKSAGFFGTTGFQLLRKCPCPVWLVAPNTTPKFKHILACVDTSSGEEADATLNDRVYDLAKAIAQHHHAAFSVAHVWDVFGEQMLRSRMSPEELANVERFYEKDAQRLFDDFLKTHNSSINDPNAHLIKGITHYALPEFARKNGVDLVVMGTVARSGLSGMLMGNTAERILMALQCSVLAIKPEGFVTPIKLQD